MFFVFFAVAFLLFCMMFFHGAYRRAADAPRLKVKADFVKKFGLTDMCLFTDARYTRHPSLADLNTPFQDFPLSFEHFPSGSIIMPPPHLDFHALD